jgi:hypothetical protein
MERTSVFLRTAFTGFILRLSGEIEIKQTPYMEAAAKV